MAATALAPTIGAALAGGLGSYPALFLALAGTGGISSALMTGTEIGAKPEDHAGGESGAELS